MKKYFVAGLILQTVIIIAAYVLQNAELIQNINFGVLFLVCFMGATGLGSGVFGLKIKQKENETKDDYYARLYRANMRVVAFLVPCVVTLVVYARTLGITIPPNYSMFLSS